MSDSPDLDAPRREVTQEAMSRWLAVHDGRALTDHPNVSIWYPAGYPYGRLEVHSHGCHDPDTLPRGETHAYLTVGGVQFGGRLTDLELLLDAAREVLSNLRVQESEMERDV